MILCSWFQTIVSSSSDYSSSSSEEDSRIPVAKTRAKTNHAEESKPSVPLNNRRVTYAELMKRKAEDDRMDDCRRRRDRVQRRMLTSEDKLRSRADGVTSDSDASEDESAWVPRDLKIKPDWSTREIEKLVKADLEAEREKEEDWYSLYNDPEIHLDFVNGPDSDSDEEFEEDSAKDDDDKSDNSGKSDDSDESDE
ncbi:glutamic acid-rich protein-like [Papaver somniferum]|uniref:glutamic acid-rich protein-like n=1 Tax=Papaver somniferum TaxID=3469 RepID=UPI000E6F6E3C|nr:glutamic acid-rich protein-like [Papaver somniferum]